MAQTFKERAEKLAQMDQRALVGLALGETLHDVPDLAVLYADVGRRFSLEDFQAGGVLPSMWGSLSKT